MVMTTAGYMHRNDNMVTGKQKDGMDLNLAFIAALSGKSEKFPKVCSQYLSSAC